MKRVVAYVPDLMDRSRIRSVAADAEFASDLDALVEAAGAAHIVVVDLGRDGALEALPSLVARVAEGASVIGFGAHVDRELLARAEEAGCTAVLPRSQFFRRLPELLRELA